MLAAFAAGLATGLTNEPDFSVLDIVIETVVIVLANGIVALLIISRYPRHTVGWLLLILSLNLSIVLLGGVFNVALARSFIEPSSVFIDFLAWLEIWTWFPYLMIPLVFVPLFFPNGRLLSRRWRFVLAAAIIALIAGSISLAIDPGTLDSTGATSLNPFELAAAAPIAEFLWQYLATPTLLVAIIGSLISVILRYLRSGSRQRAQMKWLFYPLSLGIIVLLIWPFLYDLLPESMRSTFSEGEISNSLISLLALALPIAIGIAVLRSRLYDIDVIIRKTLVYGLLTGVLLLVYLGGVVLLQQLFAGISGQRSPVAIVISTLAIAALFRPLRGRIQSFIDRRFYRRSYDASQTLADFAATARDEVDLNQLTAELVRVIQETMQPEQVGLWLAPMEGQSRDGDERR